MIYLRFVLLLVLLFTPQVHAIESDEWLNFSGYQGFPSVYMKNHKWQETVTFWHEMQSMLTACENREGACYSLEIMDIISMLKIINKAHGLEKVKRLNRYVNMQLGHTINKGWYKSLSFLQAEPNTGVFTALKYFLLKRLGFTGVQMRVVVVKNSLTGGRDSLLFIRLENKNYVLSKNFNTVIEMHKLVKIFTPLYAINESKYWLYSTEVYQNIGDSYGK